MQIDTELIQGVRVYRLSGKWTDGPEGGALRAQIKAALAAGERKFVVDMEGIDLLNSIGLGGLVSCYTSTTREKGTLKISGLSERNRRAAFVSRILDLFEDYPNATEAVASFGG
jgi:anti-sigma B factor antagonist